MWSRVRAVLASVATMLRGRGGERQLSDELAFHVDQLTQDNMRAGMPAAEARRQALIELGGVDRTTEEYRDAAGVQFLHNVRSDARYAIRQMRRSPGFTALAVLTLSLGIGANSAMFSIVNAVLLKPLPYADPDRLVRVWETPPGSPDSHNVVNVWNFLDWQARTRTLEQIALIEPSVFDMTGRGEPVALRGLRVSPDFFSILRAQPLFGRAFEAADGTPGRNDVAILSYGLWQQRFGGGRAVIGSRVALGGDARTVVGVMQRAFSFPPNEADVWVPLAVDRSPLWRGGRSDTTVARLKPGVTMAQAQQDLTAIASQISRERPDENKEWGAAVTPLRDDLVGDVRLPLLVFLAVVAFVLLIACANVANLLLMRAAARYREIAVRSALGATRKRIVQQLLCESVVLALAGCAVGLVAARWALRAVVALIPESAHVPRLDSVHLDGTAFAFAVTISIATAIMFGLAPAFQLARVDLNNALKKGILRTGVGGARKSRELFVVAQMSLALVLLAGAGIMIRSFVKLLSVDPGFGRGRILTLTIAEPFSQVLDARKRSDYLVEILNEVRRTPGVHAAGSIHFLPLMGLTSGTCFQIGAAAPQSQTGAPTAAVLVVSDRYFAAMGVPVLNGREFTDRDRFNSPSVTVVNRAFAQAFFPGRNPVGAHLGICWDIPNPVEIVGVVADARQTELQRRPRPTIFLANAQTPRFFATLVVSTESDPRGVERAVQDAVHRAKPLQAVGEVRTMDEVYSRSLAWPRLQLTLLLLFAGIALVLAAIGVYGVVSYSVTQRTDEIGLRMALGARPGRILAMVAREGMALAVLGLAIGTVMSLALTRVLRGLLFEVSPTDPLALAGACCLLAIVAAAAVIGPARRATKLDPLVTLRYE